jgi:hypothetical protein
MDSTIRDANGNRHFPQSQADLLEALRAIQRWSWTLPFEQREADVWKPIDAAIAHDNKSLEQVPYDPAIESTIPLAIPTPQQLLNDPCTPFWAQDVIRIALQKDAVDVANMFEVLAQSFAARAKAGR